MKKNVQFNQTSRNFVKDPIVEDDNGEEEFFHNSAITTNTMDIICGNLTPQITYVTIKLLTCIENITDIQCVLNGDSC